MPHLRMSARAPTRLLLVATVLLVAINLRPGITVVGPLLETIGTDTGMSPTQLGVLGAIPVVAFGMVSPVANLLGARFGVERTIFAALLLLTAGTLLRSAGHHLLLSTEAGLFLGTLLLASAMGIGNVLLPAVVKRDFPDRVALMTGIYTATLVGAAAVFSAAAVPLGAWLGWRGGLATPALLTVLGAVGWMMRRGATAKSSIASSAAEPRPEKPTSVLRQALAWQVTLFFGMQSSLYFVLLNWFPAIQTWHGTAEAPAGYWLGVFQAVGVAGSLAIGALMQRSWNQQFIAAAVPGLMLAGLVGMIAAPSLMPVWAVVSGLASGSLLMLGLSFISLRSGGGDQVTSLSGMAQGFGYLLAAAGPVLAGSLYQAFQSWTPVLWTLVAVAGCLMIMGLYVGRNVQLRR